MTNEAEFLRRLNNLKAIKDELKVEIEATATDVEIDAIRAAPIGINSKIQKSASNGGLSQQINVNAGKIGAYVEFGTGQSAAALVPTLEDWAQDVARRFYVNGQGKLRAAPYFYPAWVRHTTGFEQRIRVILEKAVQ